MKELNQFNSTKRERWEALKEHCPELAEAMKEDAKTENPLFKGAEVVVRYDYADGEHKSFHTIDGEGGYENTQREN